MLERETKRRYNLEMGATGLVYAVVLFGSITMAKGMEPGIARTLLLLTPASPVFLLVWVIARHFARIDEFVRLRSLESLSLAAAVTAGLSFTYGFLESAGFPKISMFWVWGVMGTVWGGHAWLRCLFAK